MNDDIDAIQRPFQTGEVAHITDEKPQLFLGKVLRHLVLLELIAGIDDDPTRPMLGKQPTHEGLSERTGSAGHENGRAVECRTVCLHVSPIRT